MQLPVFLGYQIVPDDITNSISVVIVLLAIYYAAKIVRLSTRFEYVALKGGRAPYYIIAGLLFLAVERFLDLFTATFAKAVGYPLATTFNDPPAALSAFFIFLGLREMYVVYIRNSRTKKAIPTHREIWKLEEKASAAPSSA